MSTELAKVEAPRLPYPAAAIKVGVDESMWHTLVTATFPSAATPEGVLLALSYCKHRNLDIFKRPVHIVPISTKVKTADGKEAYKTIESVWPGINELRITAFRTGAYGGCDPATFGPDITSEWELGSGSDEPHPNAPPEEKKKESTAAKKMMKVTHPEWCQITVYRLIEGQRIAFPGPRVYWLETYATQGKVDRPNSMWQDRARGQLEKCAEAAALRKAFPEELSSEYTIDEAPRMVDITPAAAAAPEARPDRTEIERKPKGAPKPKDDAPKPEVVIEEKADGRNGNDGPGVEQSGATSDHAVTTSADYSEALEHAMAALPKLTLEEMEGAKEELRKRLSKEEFVVWHTAALERHRTLKARR